MNIDDLNIVSVDLNRNPNDRGSRYGDFGPTISISTEETGFYGPATEKFVFKKYTVPVEDTEATMYIGKYGTFCRFYAYDRPGQGFGGAIVHAHMEDGTTEKLIGPWSSRVGIVNQIMVKNFDAEYVEVVINRCVAHITVSEAKRLLRAYHPEYKLIAVSKWGGERYWVVQKRNVTWVAVWPDNDWCMEDEISEYDWKSDDYEWYDIDSGRAHYVITGKHPE